MDINNTNSVNSPAPSYKRTILVFCVLWVITFILYLPAARAGKVGEYYHEWLDVLMNKGFRYFIHPQDFPSLYHFTQLTTYIFYRIFGFGAWPWHVLALTVHVGNALLLYLIFGRLLSDSKVKYGRPVAFGGSLLYCISSYNSEVIVHEPCYHYTQGFFMLLLVLLLLQYFIRDNKTKYAWLAGLVYLASSYAIEIFYLTPIFIFTFILYYRNVLTLDKLIARKAIFYFVIPEVIIFIIHLIVLRAATGHVIGHYLEAGSSNFLLEFLAKTPKYLFHVVFLGRYFPDIIKHHVYDFCDSKAGMMAFGGFLVSYYLFIIIQYKKLSDTSKLIALLFTWTLLCAGLVCMLAFPNIQYVLFDRYTYFMMPFIYLTIVLIVSKIRNTAINVSIFVAYCVVNLFFAIKINNYWYQSSRIITGLMNTFPNAKDKVVLLLNPPENMNGALMIGSGANSAFRLMYNFENKNKITSPVYDVASYNMISSKDGVHVTVYDNVIHVTLNQWGTWWWYAYQGAKSYENDEYKLNMTDVGHWYELTLKHPFDHYILLYQVGDQWKQVDWNKKNVDQY